MSERLPRLGFLGLGWIGANRMQAVLEHGVATVAAVADPHPEALARARELVPGAKVGASLDELLALDLDGVVIATPSAMHAEQATAALERGFAVFCQKPLGRNAPETQAIVDAARRADRLLGVDFSYRHTEGLRAVRRMVRAGELGRVFALDVVFHNAYGPDKDWFYDRARSGGGCVIDLGIHLVDAALWVMDFPAVTSVHSQLYAAGRPLAPEDEAIEDYAVATLTLESGAVVRLACSWRLQAGADALISAHVYGTDGGACLRNVDGSFYDFVAERFRGTACEQLAAPPDRWGGRAIVAWARTLGERPGFDEEAARLVDVAHAVDRVYGRG